MIEALRDLKDTTVRLEQKHRELADLQATEKEARVTNYFRSQESSVSARDRDAEFQTLNITTDIIRLKGEIAGLTLRHQTLLAEVAFHTHQG